MKMKLIKSVLPLTMAVTTVLSAMGQDKMIDGYFRIKSAGGKYVNVNGPVSATPNKSYDEALSSPGSIFYLSAIQDKNNYLIKNLRSQGLDIARDEVPAKEYVTTFNDILNAGGDINTAIINAATQYGYTAIGRITIGYVLSYVGTSLWSYNYSGDNFTTDDYSSLVDDFNENVLEKVDLGLRMQPTGTEGNVKLFYDVPTLQPVVDWYQATDTEEHQRRHNVFESAMKSMTQFLLSRSGISLETFRAEDVRLLNDWGYDLSDKWPDHKVDRNGETVYNFTFAEIFSDADLLFNWVKMVGYMIVEPDADKYDRIKYLREFNGLSELLKSDEMGQMLIDNLPRLQPGIRVYLTNNNGQFGFAEESEMEEVGVNGIWVLQPTDTGKENLTLEIEHFNSVETSARNYTGLYLDFPVEVTDMYAELMTLSDVQNITANGKTYNYTELQSISRSVDAHTPFIIEDRDAYTTLRIVNDGLIFRPITPAPDNSLPVSDEEVTKQHTPAKRQADGTQVMYGVLVDTPAESVMNSLGFDNDKPLYSISQQNEFVQANDHLALRIPEEGNTIKANEIIYSPSQSLSTDQSGEPVILVGQPDIPTGIDMIGSDSRTMEQDVIYDLSGVRVMNPQQGQIYILNGKKILVM